MMRVIAGKYKARKIKSPINKRIRPTSDRAKEMIFSTLSSILEKQNKLIQEMITIDAFCGTGSLGIEAISRGAKKVIFIDNDESSLKLVLQNCEELEILNKTLIKLDLKEFTYKLERADLIFLDPPYGKFNLNNLVEKICIKKILKPNGIGVIETSKKCELNESKLFTIINKKKTGNSIFYFFTRK